MYPELFRIPWLDWPVNSFGVLVLIGVLAALGILRRGARKKGLDPDRVTDNAVWMVLVGLLGARLFYVVQFWSDFETSMAEGRWWEPLAIWNGGIVVYGGFISATACLLFLQWRQRSPLLPIMDVMAPATAVGMLFGRLGCFLNGCCWGKVCAEGFWLGVRFPADSPPSYLQFGRLATPPLHPTQLYSSLNALLITLVLFRLMRYRLPHGVVAGACMVLYGLGRFTLEEIRGDHTPDSGSWPVSQSISAVVVLVGATLAARALRAASASPARAGSPADA